MSIAIDLNVDMGESFGRYKLGNDEEVMKYITSANVACGFHAADATVIYETVSLAKENGVAVGAHVGLPDLQGFGRRQISMSPLELQNDILYQLGALDAFLRINGMKIQHVKPHGALYKMVSENEDYANACLDAVIKYNRDMYIYVPRDSKIWHLGKKLGLNMVAEVLVDLNYDSRGNFVIERKKRAWSPEEVARRAITVVMDKRIKAIDGNDISVQADTICCHGDSANAAEVVRKINEEFAKLGIALKNFQH